MKIQICTVLHSRPESNSAPGNTGKLASWCLWAVLKCSPWLARLYSASPGPWTRSLLIGTEGSRLVPPIPNTDHNHGLAVPLFLAGYGAEGPAWRKMKTVLVTYLFILDVLILDVLSLMVPPGPLTGHSAGYVYLVLLLYNSHLVRLSRQPWY